MLPFLNTLYCTTPAPHHHHHHLHVPHFLLTSTSMQTYRIGLLTWNVGGLPPNASPPAEQLLSTARHVDVIVLGLQEASLTRRASWKSFLLSALGPHWAYVGGHRYAGMRVKVFARLSPIRPVAAWRLAPLPSDPALMAHRPRVPVVGVTAPGKRVGAGVADRWPNKGAVAVEICFGTGCRAVFVVAHLAANEEGLKGREDDWRAILRRLDRDEMPLGRGDVISVPMFHRYEHVFVLGDLNYRISPPGSDHASRVRWVQQRAAMRDWQALVARDQLTRERACGKVFANFEEGTIAFAPTFKIDPYTGGYASTRVPSYCDRILWHSLPARVELVECLRYTALGGVRDSDHIPVYAEFALRVPIVAAPGRELSGYKGVRLVLEFMLVRFVKGDGRYTNAGVSDGRRMMRHMKQGNLLRASSISMAGTAQAVVDESADGSSCTEEEGDENWDANGDSGYYSPYEGPDAVPQAEGARLLSLIHI